MTALQRPPLRLDLLRVPGLGRLLRWRWGRLFFQSLLLLVAGLIIYDGLTGPQLAPENIATVAAWIHYRGLVMLALLMVGNLFCMSCPFTLPRTVARRFSRRGGRWPRALRNKWPAIGLLFIIFFLYEWLDLWASPLWTAWLAAAYFVAALVLEALFAESPFCKYLCPLGSFNFVASTVSPFQVRERAAEVCRSCEGKDCVNGNERMLGCGTELFVPQIDSNLDCIFCLDCARACPHDNVALALRSPLQEGITASWPRRWDVSLLALVFVFASLSNAFGMVPPVYALLGWLAAHVAFLGEFGSLLLLLATLDLLLPLAVGMAAAALSRHLAASRESLRVVLARHVPALVPLAVAIWFAHYGFHFATGALSIVPVLQNFLLDHGVRWPGAHPNWTLSAILPFRWLFPLQVIVVLAGLLATLYALGEGARREEAGQRLLAGLVPWVVVAVALALIAVWIFSLPMEMRGTNFYSG
ncbi:MAG: hypothetical protein D6775_01530 [Caldilineae bacterium]|nr:MAG: hypothetical protein D6775_01530 [Caldilineae bacterium]